MRLAVLSALVTLVVIAGCKKEPFPSIKRIPGDQIRLRLKKRYVGMSREELYLRHGKPTAIQELSSLDPVSHKKVTTHFEVYTEGEVSRHFTIKDRKVVDADYSMKSWSENRSESRAAG